MIIMFLFISIFPDIHLLADENNSDNQKLPVNNDTRSIKPTVEDVAPPEEPAVKNLGNGRFQIGNIIIDEDKKEVIVPGRLNMTEGPIEFIACTKDGMKAYESVLEMDTDAKSFNLSMILLGLDPKKGKAAAYHFDPNPPEGDAVEILVKINIPGQEREIMAQDLIYDMNTNRTFPADNWIYTGSIFLEDGRYLAEDAGVLIGFVHDPASIIESHYSGEFPEFGSFVVNKNYLDKIGTKIQMIIRPVDTKVKKKQEAGSKKQEK